MKFKFLHNELRYLVKLYTVFDYIVMIPLYVMEKY